VNVSSSRPHDKTVELFGITFLRGNYADLLSHLAPLKGPRQVVVPSAPVLSELSQDADTRQALENADIAIPDSGFMLLLLRLFKRIKLPKYSGYKLIGDLLADPSFVSSKLLLIDPDQNSSTINAKYLGGLGLTRDRIVSYIAPLYPKKGQLVDDDLNALIAAEQPANILINLGGMTQERLGAGIKEAITHDCRIFCTGAAIAFYTGQQAPMNNLVDRFYLGWLWRCLRAPRTFVPRYAKAARLVPQIFFRSLH
jgi:UDP-N-acetyl-D-mannosaminuronic acid transferase (WecB/TagA/CpsF family)